MPPDLKAYTHDDLPAHETWLHSATADGGRLRMVLLAADPQAAAPLLARARSIAQVFGRAPQRGAAFPLARGARQRRARRSPGGVPRTLRPIGLGRLDRRRLRAAPGGARRDLVHGWLLAVRAVCRRRRAHRLGLRILTQAVAFRRRLPTRCRPWWRLLWPEVQVSRQISFHSNHCGFQTISQRCPSGS